MAQVLSTVCVTLCCIRGLSSTGGSDTWDRGGGLSGGGLHFGVGDGNPDAGTRELCAEVASSCLIASLPLLP